MAKARKVKKSKALPTGATGLCEGTDLRTPFGERKIENLRQGDLVVTRDNGLQPVRLIWARTLTKAEVAADPSLAPVYFAPRAIGPMMPKRALQVGAAHRLLIPGWRLEDEDDTTSCLIPARDVDGLSLGNEGDPDEVTYYNIVFDEPQVFSANGLPVESFTPSEETLAFSPKDVREAMRSLFPDLGPKFADYPTPRYKVRERASYTPDWA